MSIHIYISPSINITANLSQKEKNHKKKRGNSLSEYVSQKSKNLGLVFPGSGMIHLSFIMNKKGRRSILGIFCLCLGLSLVSGCDPLPYMPDENAIIFMTAIPTAIEAGGSSKITVVGEKESGYPLPDGTTVYLFASHGEIDTEIPLTNGRAEVKYDSDSNFIGDVIITAHSGQATISPEQLTITITEVVKPDIEYLYISANPIDLPQSGGRSDVTVLAVDGEMQPIANKNIWLETTAGSLSGNGFYQTNNTGTITVSLTTDRTATITARYKELSSSVTVTVEE